MDSRSVVLLSTFASAKPLSECKRYDKKRKCTIMVPCPSIVQEYNKNMGVWIWWIHLWLFTEFTLDQKNFIIRFFYHFLDVTVVNCWLLYRRDCQSLEIPQKNVMMLQEFKLEITECLLMEGKNPAAKKEAGHQLENLFCFNSIKNKSSPATKAFPSAEVRTDGFNHFLIVVSRGHCKNLGCKAAPVYFCQKCKVHLCITKDKNCFLYFHTNCLFFLVSAVCSVTILFCF